MTLNDGTMTVRRHPILHLLLVAALLVGAPALVGCQSYRTGESRTAGQVTDDLAIQTAVTTRLIADEEIVGRRIQTQVYKGVVTLNGRVSDDASRAKAVRIAQEVKGVVSVEDRLTIVPE